MLVSPNVDSSLRMRSIFEAGELSASLSRATRGLRSMRHSSVGQTPGQRFAGAQWLEHRVAERDTLGQRPVCALERDAIAVARQAVEVRPVEARERLQSIERADRFERLRVQLECG